MVIEYLEERRKIIEKVLEENTEQLERNYISIVEMKKEIKDLDNMVDEASKIFSVKARADNGFKNHQIGDIEIKITALLSENKIIEKNIEDAKSELKIINDSINEFRNDYVSRETKYKRRRPSIKREVIDKLKLCKEINSIDNARVSIELDEILKLLS